MDLSTSGHTVELKPYDVHSGHEICTAVILNLEHVTSLSHGSPVHIRADYEHALELGPWNG